MPIETYQRMLPELLDRVRGAVGLQVAWVRVQPYVQDGLVQTSPDRILITSKGLPLARLIAACFDPLTAQPTTQKRYSQAV